MEAGEAAISVSLAQKQEKASIKTKTIELPPEKKASNSFQKVMRLSPTETSKAHVVNA